MSTINKVNKLKDSISKQSLSYGLISNSYSIEFTLDNDNTKADNVVEVFSLDEAEEIVKCIITENTNGLNNKVKSYNAPMFLTASLILPR